MASPAAVLQNETEAIELTPREIVRELDRFIIAQEDAKRAVAIALRNRWRRLRVAEEFRDEITPKNILMIGPTGVGKTEISRRLAKLVNAPFVKVEASKFTEVGYVGRDVESIIRELAERAHQLVKNRELENVRAKAEELVEDQLLDILLPGSRPDEQPVAEGEETQRVFLQDESGVNVAVEEREKTSGPVSTRDRLREMLREGRMDERPVEIEIQRQQPAQMQLLGPQGMGEIEGQIKDIFQNLIPKQKETKRVTVRDARKLLLQDAQESLLDHDAIARMAVTHAEQSGIVFIDEIDKICASGRGSGPDVSREGVQRDLLPLVEGSSVATRYGQVRTDHVLFVASGAFHSVKPSDLMPEFQGRFPIRVELRSLTSEHFERILTEPDNALTKQYSALLATEGVEIEFTRDGISELAALTAEVNSRTEDIGARRLHTVLEKLFEELSFDADQRRGSRITIDRQFVREKLKDIVQDVDLSRFIL